MLAKIDAHHHLFVPDSGHFPMLAGPSVERFYGHTGELNREFAAAQFIALARTQNVVKSVYVESGFHPSIQESAYVQKIANENGFPHAIVGKVDLESPSIESDLDIHMQCNNFRGVRLSLNHDADPRRATASRAGMAAEERWRNGYRQLAQRGLSADIMILPSQFADVAALAADFPRVQIILNHTGLPFADGDPGLRSWQEGMNILSGFPNIAVKISGLGMVDHRWTAESIRGIVLTTIELFGADRCSFASNFPIDGLYSSYATLFDAFETITQRLPRADREKLFHDTAARLYQI